MWACRSENSNGVRLRQVHRAEGAEAPCPLKVSYERDEVLTAS